MPRLFAPWMLVLCAAVSAASLLARGVSEAAPACETVRAKRPPRIEWEQAAARTFDFIATQFDADGGASTPNTAAELRLRIDGVQQGAIPQVRSVGEANEPLCVEIAVQTNSPADRELAAIGDSLARLVDGLPPSSRVGLIEFADIVGSTVDPAPPADVAPRIRALAARPAPETNLAKPCRASVEAVKACNAKSRAVIFVSTGLATNPAKTKSDLIACASDAGARSIRIHTIRFDPFGQPDPGTLSILSDRSQGTARCAQNGDDLRHALASTADELRFQRVLGFTVDEDRYFDGQPHDLELADGTLISDAVRVVLVPLPDSGISARKGALIALAVLAAVLSGAALLILRRRRAQAPSAKSVPPAAPQRQLGEGKSTVQLPPLLLQPPRNAEPPAVAPDADRSRPDTAPIPPLPAPMTEPKFEPQPTPKPQPAVPRPSTELFEIHQRNAVRDAPREQSEPTTPAVGQGRSRTEFVADASEVWRFATAWVVLVEGDVATALEVTPGVESSIPGVRFRCDDDGRWSCELDGMRRTLDDNTFFVAAGRRYGFKIGRARAPEARTGPRLEIKKGLDAQRIIHLQKNVTVTLGGGAAAEQIMRGDRMADIHLAARWDGASSCELAILSGRTEYSIQRQDLPPARWLTLEPGQEAVLVGTADDRGRCISISFDTL